MYMNYDRARETLGLGASVDPVAAWPTASRSAGSRGLCDELDQIAFGVRYVGDVELRCGDCIGSRRDVAPAARS